MEPLHSRMTFNSYLPVTRINKDWVSNKIGYNIWFVRNIDFIATTPHFYLEVDDILIPFSAKPFKQLNTELVINSYTIKMLKELCNAKWNIIKDHYDDVLSVFGFIDKIVDKNSYYISDLPKAEIRYGTDLGLNFIDWLYKKDTGLDYDLVLIENVDNLDNVPHFFISLGIHDILVPCDVIEDSDIDFVPLNYHFSIDRKKVNEFVRLNKETILNNYNGKEWNKIVKV